MRNPRCPTRLACASASSRASSAKKTDTRPKATPRFSFRASISQTSCTTAQMAELQGGQKVRVLLAQALYGDPRPCSWTAHEPSRPRLDSLARRVLERYDGTFIVISHDRHFLNMVCTHIADIDYQTIITYTGGYDDMVVAKTQIRTRIEADNAQREKKIAQLNDFIGSFGAGTRASQVHVAPQGSRTAPDDGARPIEHSAPLHQVPDTAALWKGRARIQRR